MCFGCTPENEEHPETLSTPKLEVNVKQRVRKLILQSVVTVDSDGMWGEYLDDDDQAAQDSWGGYLYQLTRAALEDELGAALH